MNDLEKPNPFNQNTSESPVNSPGIGAFTAEDIEKERTLAQREGRGNWTSTKFESEKELEIKKKIQELKARKPLPQKEAQELKGLYLELEIAKEANTRKRERTQLTSEQRMSLKDIIAKAKADRQDATKNEGEFVRERTELMEDNTKLAKDIDELSKVVRDLEGKSGKEKSDAAALLKSLRTEKRELENTLTGYKPEGSLARGEFLMIKLLEAVGLQEKTEKKLAEARKKTNKASSDEERRNAINEESRAEAEALKARTDAEGLSKEATTFVSAQKHTAAEADSISNIGAEKKPATGKKEVSVGPGMTKPHELISGPTQKPAQEKVAPVSPAVATSKTTEVTNAAPSLPLKETLEKGVAGLAGASEQLHKVIARLAELRAQPQNPFNKSSHTEEIAELEKEEASLKKRVNAPEKIATLNAEGEISLIKEFESNVYNLKKGDVVAEAKEHWEKEKSSGVDLEISPEGTIKKEFESFSAEEKKMIGLGLHNIGFFIEEGKNQLFADLFGGARKKLEGAGFLSRAKAIITGISGEKEEVEQAGPLDNWLLSFSENMQKNADASRKKIEESGRTSISQIGSLSAVTSNALKYGRVITDLFGVTALTSPLRYYMMGGMMFGQGVAAMKEARFKNVEVLEKTRVKDINAAAEEAWKIYELALSHKENGKKSIDEKDLERAYLESAPKDILNRLKKDAEPGTASKILENIIKRDIRKSVESINKKLEEIELNGDPNPVVKKMERDKIINKYEQHIKDLDRAVSQFGTVDALALGAKYGEVAAKAVVGGVMAETLVLSIDKLWEKIPSLMHSMSEALPTNEIVMASTVAAEKIPSFVETAKPGDNVWKMVEHQLLSHEKGFATLSPEKQTYVIDALKDRVTANPQAFGLTDANKVSVGQSINFSKLLQDKELVSKAFTGAQKLTDAQIENIKHYETPTPNDAPAPEAKTAPAPAEKPAVPAPIKPAPEASVAHPNESVKAGPTTGTFKYEGGKVVGITTNNSSVTPPDRAKVLNTNWQETLRGNKTIGDTSKAISAVEMSANDLFLQEEILKNLEQKGQGGSAEATWLKNAMTNQIKDIEQKYGDVFKNPEDFNKPAVSVPEKTVSPSAISSEILPGKPGIARVDGLEVTNNPQSIATADTMVRGVVKTTWGSSGFLGFGGTDGMEVFKKYDGMSIKEVLALPDTGTDKQMHGILNEALKQTNIKWSEKEGVSDYLHRATAVAIDKLSKPEISRAELKNAPIFNP